MSTIIVSEGETYTIPLQPNPNMDIVLRGGSLVLPEDESHMPHSVTIWSGAVTRTGKPKFSVSDVPQHMIIRQSHCARTILARAGL